MSLNTNTGNLKSLFNVKTTFLDTRIAFDKTSLMFGHSTNYNGVGSNNKLIFNKIDFNFKINQISVCV